MKPLVFIIQYFNIFSSMGWEADDNGLLTQGQKGKTKTHAKEMLKGFQLGKKVDMNIHIGKYSSFHLNI